MDLACSFPGPHSNLACFPWSKFWQAVPLSSVLIHISADSKGTCILISTENTTALQRVTPFLHFLTIITDASSLIASAWLTDEVPFIVFSLYFKNHESNGDSSCLKPSGSLSYELFCEPPKFPLYRWDVRDDIRGRCTIWSWLTCPEGQWKMR